MELESAPVANCTLDHENYCGKCGKTFDKPKIVQYNACPHCLTKIESCNKETGCKYWFGYLSQKDKNQAIPQECVECQRVIECMLSKYDGSPAAVKEIKKWF